MCHELHSGNSLYPMELGPEFVINPPGLHWEGFEAVFKNCFIYSLPLKMIRGG